MQISSIPSKLLLVARQLVAEETPDGLSGRGLVAFRALQEGVASKQIYNAAYEDIKRVLARDLERFSDGVSSLLGGFLYWGSNYRLLDLRSIEGYVRDVRSFIQKDDPSSIPEHRRQELIDNWDKVKHEAEEHLRRLETWKPIASMLKEIKPFIIKGRKPSGLAPARYVPPMAGAEAIKLVADKLSEVTKEHQDSLAERIANRYLGVVEKYQSGDVYSFLKRANMREIYNAVVNQKNGVVEQSLHPDYKERVRSFAKKRVDEMVEQYVAKNVRKIASLVHAKGQPSKVDAKGQLEGWGFGGSINFEFPDGTGFTVINQAIMKWTTSGQPFNQFPTTFHDVTFLDGTRKAIISEQDMNEKWAKESAMNKEAIARELVAMARELVAGALFDVDSADEAAKRLHDEMSKVVPFVGIQKSTLGGPQHVTLMVRVSLEPKEQWENGIFENSPTCHFSIENDGVIEQFRSFGSGKDKFRKTRVKDLDSAIQKIVAYLRKASAG